MKRLIETLKYWLEAGIISLVLIAIALVGLAFFRPAFASDYIDHYQQQGLTLEELSEIERKADEAWIAEYGDIPPNLTQESEKYLEKMTALLQKERNNDKN